MWLSLAVPPVLIVIALLLQRIESSVLSPELFASAGVVPDRTATAADLEPAQATSGRTPPDAAAALSGAVSGGVSEAVAPTTVRQAKAA